MHELTELIRKDMVPALGVTEPGAIEARVIGLDRPAMNITGSGAHGINGFTPEDTMRNMGRIASPGMTMTEKTIVEIQQEKLHA